MREFAAPSTPVVLIAVLVTVAWTPAPAGAQFGNIGLSSIGSQRFWNPVVPPVYVPESGDQFAAVLATGDFDGDGADDLAVGIPFGDVSAAGEVEGSGMVIVIHGFVGGGLADAQGPGSMFLSQAESGSPDPAESSDTFGYALAACDFDGDGFDDLAVGVPTEDGVPVPSFLDVGAVDVYYGSPAGLTLTGAQHLTPMAAGFPSGTGGAERFGTALACGELVGGGPFDDLAIGVPGRFFGDAGNPKFEAGMVLVARGGASGLSAAGSLVFHQDFSTMADATESYDHFGEALATLDMNGDGFADLAIGVPGEDNLSEVDGRGAIHLVFGSASGLAVADNFLRTESGFNGNSELGDRFGHALAAGDFDGDGFDDLAVGVPGEDVGSVSNAGQTVAIYGRAAAPFFEFSRTQFWTEDLIHFPGASEEHDRLGFALAAGDFDRDGRDDLAMGNPGEFVLVDQDGAVTVIMGSSTGLSNLRRHGLSAGYDGNPGIPNQAFRFYGSALAAGDFDGNGYADLAIGAPGEDEEGLTDVGAAVVLYGSLFCDGLEVQNTGFWSSAVP